MFWQSTFCVVDAWGMMNYNPAVKLKGLIRIDREYLHELCEILQKNGCTSLSILVPQPVRLHPMHSVEVLILKCLVV